MQFLKAHWRDLVMINWAIDPERVAPWVPEGCEVDCFQGRTYASLVAFMFRDTRVLGVPFPGHVHFEEVNLRLYVRRVMPDGEERRGVVFVKEIVPRRLIAWVARTLYGEPYVYMPMSHQRTTDDEGRIQLQYCWGDHRIDLVSGVESRELAADTEPHFIAEHYWGYTARPSGPRQYRVTHPPWRWRELESIEKRVDMGALYGNDWADLNDAEPSSQFLAEGSEISVAPWGGLQK